MNMVDSQRRNPKGVSSLWKVLAALCVLALASVLAACGGDDSKSSSGGSQEIDELPVSDAGDLGEPVPAIKVIGPSPGYDPAENEAMQLMVDAMKEIGLKVEYQGFPDFTSLADATAANDFGDFAIVSAGYLGNVDRLEPSALLTPTFTCDAVGDSNWSGYCRDEFDQLLADANAELDEGARKELIDEIQDLLADDLPMLVLYHPAVPAVYNSSDVSDVVLSPAAAYFHFQNLVEANPADGAITVGASEAGAPLNPMCNEGSYFQTYEYQGLIYDRLTRIDAEGNPQLWMAESIERDGDTTVVVKLRDGLEFSNGDPVTADDVKFTYDYINEWKVGYYSGPLGHVKSISTEGDDTVIFELKDAYAQIEAELFGRVGILPKSIWENVVEKEGLKHPCDYQKHDFIGSGPYTLDYYDPAQGIRLLRNDGYFEPANAKEIIGRVYSSQQSLFQDLLAGEVDFTDSDPGFTPSQISQAEGNSNLTVEDVETLTVRFMQFNLRDGSPFQDLALRTAVGHMLDSGQIVGGILAGRGTAGAGIIAPANTRWHNEEVEFPAYNPQQAVEVLTEAGYGWDESGRLHFPSDHEPQVFAEAAE